MSNFEYGGVYKKYDMSGEIQIGTGTVKVHDIFDPLPEFMKQADVIFSDPPCSEGNLRSFYTKADKELMRFFDAFRARFFECIDEIKPETLFVEVFASNKEDFIEECKKRYSTVWVLDSHYYHSKKNKCWIIFAHNRNVGYVVDSYKELASEFDGKDEQKIIELICKNFPFHCIGDLCMGRGLVGFYANKYGKHFVGTELNKKRLAVLIERIKTGKI